MSIPIKIDSNSQVPKYQQIVNSIISDIEEGVLKGGQRIPSINETSEELYLSRDTVEKAYGELRERGMISSVRGKGYYVVSNNTSTDKMRVLLLLNKYSASKKMIYEAFLKTLSDDAIVDIQIYHYDAKIFASLISSTLDKYNYYVIVPHFFNFTHETLEVIQKIPSEKLIVMDQDIEGLNKDYGCVFQDFEGDIYYSLHDGLDLLRKYEEIVLIYPENIFHPRAIITGLRRFCVENSFKLQISDGIFDEPVKPKTAFIVIEETDLVEVIKKIRSQKNLKIGESVGILSYNESPLKEILLEGITVISTDFVKMGETAAAMIMEKKRGKVKNAFKLIRRKSL